MDIEGDNGLKIGFDVTMDDHIAFGRYLHDHDPDSKKQNAQFRKMLIFGGPIIALIIYFFTRDLLACLITAILMPVLGIMQPKLSRRGVKKWIVSNKTVQESLGPVEYEIVEEGLVHRGNNAETKVLWAGIHQIASTDDYSFIYIDPKRAHAIPRNRLTSGDYDSFVCLLKEKWEAARYDDVHNVS